MSYTLYMDVWALSTFDLSLFLGLSEALVLFPELYKVKSDATVREESTLWRTTIGL